MKAAELFLAQKNYDAYRRTQKMVHELTKNKTMGQKNGLAYNFLATLGLSFFDPGGGLLPAFSRLENKQLKQVGTLYGVFSSLCFVCSYFMIGIQSSLSLWQLFFLGIIPFVSLVLTGSLMRYFWHHRGNFAIDIFIAGIAIAPWALSALLIGFVSISTLSLIIPFLLLGASYSVLSLQASYVQLLNITEAKASSLVTLMLIINSYISFVSISSFIS